MHSTHQMYVNLLKIDFWKLISLCMKHFGTLGGAIHTQNKNLISLWTNKRLFFSNALLIAFFKYKLICLTSCPDITHITLLNHLETEELCMRRNCLLLLDGDDLWPQSPDLPLHTFPGGDISALQMQNGAWHSPGEISRGFLGGDAYVMCLKPRGEVSSPHWPEKA